MSFVFFKKMYLVFAV